MPGLIAPDRRFRDDGGCADPRLAAALTAYAAGRESEHAVLAALARARLLVPVVAAVTAAETARTPRERVLGREKTSAMALPTLTGRDGRQAMIVFTSLSALRGWRRDARPVPAPAQAVCRAAVAEPVPAVVVDVAGPVPLVLEGARLAALAAGAAPPVPAEDPDVRAAVEAVVRADPQLTAAGVLAGSADADFAVQLVLSAPDATGAAAAARRAAAAIMSALPGRFRRGIELAVVPELASRQR